LILDCSELHLQWQFLMPWQSPFDRWPEMEYRLTWIKCRPV